MKQGDEEGDRKSVWQTDRETAVKNFFLFLAICPWLSRIDADLQKPLTLVSSSTSLSGPAFSRIANGVHSRNFFGRLFLGIRFWCPPFFTSIVFVLMSTSVLIFGTYMYILNSIECSQRQQESVPTALILALFLLLTSHNSVPSGACSLQCCCCAL